MAYLLWVLPHFYRVIDGINKDDIAINVLQVIDKDDSYKCSHQIGYIKQYIAPITVASRILSLVHCTIHMCTRPVCGATMHNAYH